MARCDERAANERVDGVAQPGQASEQDARAVRRAAVAGERGRQDQGTAAEHGGRGGSGPPAPRPSLPCGPGQQAREHRRAAQGDHGGHGDAGARHGRVEGDRVPGHGERAEAEQPPLGAGAGGQHRACAAAGQQQQQAADGQAGRADCRGWRPGRCQRAGGPRGAPQRRRGEDGGRPGQRGPERSWPGKAKGTGRAGRRTRRCGNQGTGRRTGTRGNQGRGMLGHCRELRIRMRQGLASNRAHESRPTAARRGPGLSGQAVRAGKLPAAGCARSGARRRQDDVPV